jgi:malate/lactate dehydrogenase
VFFEMPIILGVTGINHVINHKIENYERNHIVEMVRQRDEKIGMHMMQEQIEEKEQQSWISK